MWILWAKNSLLNSGEFSVEEPPWSLKNMPLGKIVGTITVLMYPINKYKVHLITSIEEKANQSKRFNWNDLASSYAHSEEGIGIFP